jgi:hypothetical protein
MVCIKHYATLHYSREGWAVVVWSNRLPLVSRGLREVLRWDPTSLLTRLAGRVSAVVLEVGSRYYTLSIATQHKRKREKVVDGILLR